MNSPSINFVNLKEVIMLISQLKMIPVAQVPPTGDKGLN